MTINPISHNIPLLPQREFRHSNYLGKVWNYPYKETLKELYLKVDLIFTNSCFFNFISKYSLLINDLIILGADVAFTYGSFDEDASPTIANDSYLVLTSAGVLYLYWTFSLLTKSIVDCHLSKISGNLMTPPKKIGNIPIFSATLLRSVWLTGGDALSSATLAASIYRMKGDLESVEKIYSITSYYGEANLGLGLIVTFYYLYLQKQQLKTFQTEIEEQDLFSLIHMIKTNLNDSIALTEKGVEQGVIIRSLMDKNTFWKLQETLNKLPQNRSFDELKKFYQEVMISNIRTQLRVTQSNILLKITGDILMSVEYMEQGTKIQAVINLSASTLYFIVELIRNIFQIEQRNKCDTLSKN